MQHSGEIDSPPYLVGGREFSEIRHFAQNPRGGRKLGICGSSFGRGECWKVRQLLWKRRILEGVAALPEGEEKNVEGLRALS